MARIVTRDGHVLYDDYVDLRGDQTHKNIEKTQGPNVIIHGHPIRRCPMCYCYKSFDPEIPNNVLFGCDGECPCHDGLEST